MSAEYEMTNFSTGTASSEDMVDNSVNDSVDNSSATDTTNITIEPTNITAESTSITIEPTNIPTNTTIGSTESDTTSMSDSETEYIPDLLDNSTDESSNPDGINNTDNTSTDTNHNIREEIDKLRKSITILSGDAIKQINELKMDHNNYCNSTTMRLNKLDSSTKNFLEVMAKNTDDKLAKMQKTLDRVENTDDKLAKMQKTLDRTKNPESMTEIISFTVIKLGILGLIAFIIHRSTAH